MNGRVQTCQRTADVILGAGWADLGYSATDIHPENRGAAWLLADGELPYRIKAAYLSDEDIYSIADYAAWLCRPSGITAPAPALATPTTTSEWEMAA